MGRSSVYNFRQLPARLALVALCCFQVAIPGRSRANPEPQQQQPPPSQLGILVSAIQSHDLAAGGPALLKVLADLGAAINGGKGVGASIQELLTQKGIPAGQQEPLRQTLLANWRSGDEFGLFSPENLERMRTGTLPVVTIGGYRGQGTVILSVPPGNAMPPAFRLIPVALEKTVVQFPAPGVAIPPKPAMLPLAPIIYPPASAGNIPGWRQPGMPPGHRIPFTPAPAASQPPVIDFVDIARGSSISLKIYGGGTEKIFIHEANEKEGVHYAMVDPAKIDVIKLIPNTTYHTAPWNFAPIPGTSEKGIFVTRYETISIYFVRSLDLDSVHYRMCVIAPGMRGW